MKKSRMKDIDRTKDQLINELDELLKRIIELEESEAELKQGVERLRESKEQLKTIFEAAQDAIFTKDCEGHYTQANTACATLFGITTDEMIGKTDFDLFPPDIARHIKEEIDRKVLEKGETVSVEDAKPTAGVMRTFHVVKVPLRDKNGVIIGLCGIARDISELKHSERKLRQSEEELRVVFDGVRDGIVLLNMTGKVIKINKRILEVGGYTEEEIVGKRFSLFKMFPPKSMTKMLFVFNKLILGQQVPPTVVECSTKTGNKLHIEIHANLLRKKGKSVGIVAVIRDITERKQVEKELKASHKHLELINKILRHDLINDITVIKSALRLYTKSKDVKYLEKVDESINKSVELIRRMSELESFISSHKRLKIYDVKEVVEEVKQDYTPIDLNIEGNCKVLADDAFNSVIDNIIRNALEHGKTDIIDIKIEAKGKLCEIRIADYGIGIPDELKEKVFEEGFKYGKTGHSGLGLFIVKGTLQKYGGSVHVEDNKPKGAVLILQLKRVM